MFRKMEPVHFVVCFIVFCLLLLLTLVVKTPSEEVRMASMGYTKIHYKIENSSYLGSSWVLANSTDPKDLIEGAYKPYAPPEK